MFSITPQLRPLASGRVSLAFVPRLHPKVTVAFPSVSLSTCESIHNKIRSAVAVCKTNTDPHHFFHFNRVGDRNYYPTFALSSLFASVLLPEKANTLDLLLLHSIGDYLFVPAAAL